jgi:hypothetical protein
MVLNIIYFVVYYLLFGRDINVNINLVSTNNVNNNITSTYTGGFTTNDGSITYKTITSEKLEYFEFIIELLGILSFEDFSKMSDSDKLSFIREYKINKIIE